METSEQNSKPQKAETSSAETIAHDDRLAVLKWAVKNLSYVLPALLVIVAALRLFISAGGDDATLRVLSEHLNVGALLYSSFLQILPLLLFVPAIYLLMYGFSVGGQQYVAAAWILIVCADLLSSPSQAIFNTLVFLAYHEWFRAKAGKYKNVSIVALVIYTIIWMVIYTLADTTMWLPAETFTFTNGTRVVGYEISRSTQDTTFLYRDERLVVYIDNRAITLRALCSETARSRPIITYWFNSGQAGNGTPQCPSPSQVVKPSVPSQVSPIPASPSTKASATVPASP